jgi:hypothetical protein
MGIAAYGRGTRGKFTRHRSCFVRITGASFLGEKKHMHSVDGRPRPNGTGVKRRFLRLETETNEVSTDRIWVHRAPAALLCMGIGPSAKVARFAFTDEGDHPFYAACRRLDRDVALGGLAKAKKFGLEIPFGAVGEQPLRRLAIAVALSRAGFNPDEPRDGRGRWTTGGDDLLAPDQMTPPARGKPAEGGDGLLIPARMTLPDGAEMPEVSEGFEPVTPPTSLFGPLTPAQIAALSRYALRLGGVAAALGIIFIPSDSGAVVEGTLPGHSDVTFKLDKPEGALTLWQGDRSAGHVIFQGNPDRDGIFRDVDGNPIARQLPDGTLLIDLGALPKQKPSSDNQADEPKICPAPQPDRPGPKPKDIAYQHYIAQILNPEAPTPPGFGVVLFNPVTGRYVYFDDCHHPTGVMVDAKGTGYERLMQWPAVWKGVMEDIDDQAKRQVQAAAGRPIIWFVAEKRAADTFRDYLKEKGFPITVIWVEAP